MIFPRLYQHLASIEPIRNESASLQKAKPRSPSARKEWILMNDRNDRTLPSLPTKGSQGESSLSDDGMLGNSIEGRDVEKGGS